jgi:hypothetical protein
VEAESIVKVKRPLSVNIDEQSNNNTHVPAKRRLVTSPVNEKMVIDLTLDLPSSPTTSRSVQDAVTIRGSSPLAYGSEGEEEEVRTTLICPKAYP